MTKTTCELDSNKLSLSGLLTPEQLKELISIEKCSFENRDIDSRFLYEYSLQGEFGFVPLKTARQQAFCQSLALMGCIPSMLLFGYSLSNAYPKSQRVLSDIAAFEYCFIAFERMLFNCTEPGFLAAANYMTKNRTLYEICDFLTSNRFLNDFEHQNHPVISFAETCMAGIKNEIRLDS